MSSMYITEPATLGKVCLETSLGDIDIELWGRESPLACRNFIQLCMEGYYDGCIFHRLVKDFIVQTGDPSGSGFGGESIYGFPFKSEFHQRLKFNRRGLVGMAGEAGKKDANGSQFFFTLGPTPELEKTSTLFGKVVGKTLYNLLQLNDYDVDKNERPSRIHIINKVKILNNPFDDIKPRLEPSKKSKHKDDEKDLAKRKPPVSNASLLSFADEIGDSEGEEMDVTFKTKFKSAHDVLDDGVFSNEVAVKPEELSNFRAQNTGSDGEEHKRETKRRIKEKLYEKRKRIKIDETTADVDYEDVINEQKDAERQQQMENLSAELKQLQKEYKKATKGTTKSANPDDEEASTSEGVKAFKKLQLKFKSETKGIVKTIDPKRQDQTMALLERFKKKLDRNTIQGVLTDKKVDVSDLMTREEIILATSEEQGKIDLDAKDITGEDWMVHWFVAPEDTSGVTKARDANMKEHCDEWYPIDDPRNSINVRRRMAAERMPERGE